MKTVIWAALVLVIAMAILVECRYELIVNAPVVAKMDRFTGKVYIANGGIWKLIEVDKLNNNSVIASPADTSAKK